MKEKLINLDLTSKIFGKLEVIKESVNSPRGYKRFWTVFCECGKAKDIEHYSLLSGHTKSCGCLAKQARSNKTSTHRKSYTAEYKVWDGMRQRCSNKNHNAYHYYGGRGIKVCKEWESFEVFYADMGKRPTWKHTLERKDVNEDYTPENCIWDTYKNQSRNKRNNHMISFGGEELCLDDWGRKLNIKPNTLGYRLKRGWTVEEAFYGRKNSSRTIYLEYNNEKKHITEWAEVFNIKRNTIKERLNRGWTVEKALLTPVTK